MTHPKKFSAKHRKVFFATLIATLLLLGAVTAIAATLKTENNRRKPTKNTPNSPTPPYHTLLKTTCKATRFPDLCYTAISASPRSATLDLTTQKDVISLSLNITATAVEHNHNTVKNILKTRRNLTARERYALEDCLDTISGTLEEVYTVIKDLMMYPRGKPLERHADDLKTLMSAAMTNQETCLDGFSHEDSDRHVRAALQSGQVHVERMCSNALAMIRNMTDADMATAAKSGGDDGDDKWQKWVLAGDKRRLQGSTASVKADVVVAVDGSGDFRTVAEAVAAAPNKTNKRYVIRIKEGVYKENVEVNKKKTNIMFLGDGRRKTIITGSKNVVDGSTTYHSATVAIMGERFLARDLTFQNTAGPSKHQAVALRVGADLSAFYQCDILGYQDTLYVHSNRQFFIKCLIIGTVDFIFGNAAVVFQDCDIHARRPNLNQKNMVTAQSRTDPNQNTGIVIQKCRIDAASDLKPVKGNFSTYLGRPWKEYSRTVIMQSSISDVIHPIGWHEWNGNFALDTLYYAEYRNNGSGADASRRVGWKGVRTITAAEAQGFTPKQFIVGDIWLGNTSFPFSPGL